jgi:hypothetical protein
MSTGSLESTIPDLPRLDPSAIWWSDGPYPAASPALEAPLWPPARRPRVGVSVALFLASLVLTPFAGACWWIAHAELHGMACGTVEEEARGWFRFLRLWGQCWACMMLAGILFWLTIFSFAL